MKKSVSIIYLLNKTESTIDRFKKIAQSIDKVQYNKDFFEVIFVVIGGKTTGFKKTDSNPLVRIVYSKSLKGGLVESIKSAFGNIIIFGDENMLLEPYKINSIVQSFEQNNKICLIVDNNILSIKDVDLKGIYIPDDIECWKTFLYLNILGSFKTIVGDFKNKNKNEIIRGAYLLKDHRLSTKLNIFWQYINGR